MRLRTRAVLAAGVALGGFLGTVQLWATGPVPTPALQLAEAPPRQARSLGPPPSRPALPAVRPASRPTAPPVQLEAQAPEPAEDPDLERVPVDLGLPRAEPRAEPMELRTGAGLEASQPLSVQPVSGASDLDTAVREDDEAPFF